MIAVDRGQHEPAGSRTAQQLRLTQSRLTTLPDRSLFIAVFVVALLIFGCTAAGRTIADTKLGVDIAAREFLARLWSLWNPLEWFGTLTDQYIGYALPMAPFFLVGQLLHIPVWLVERLWLSALVATGFTGMVKLARVTGIGNDASRLAAGAIFALWPVFSILLGSTSAAAIPGLVVPWAIIPLVRAVRGQLRTARAVALSGIAIALMGGVNAVSTLAVLILPALYIVTHSAGRRRIVLGLSWSAAVIAATSWWAVPLVLEGRYAFNFLPFIEQASATERTMSAAAVLQGTGPWTAYFPPGGIPWIPAGWTLVTSVACIAATVAVAAIGLAGLARRDMPERRWLGICVGLAAVVMLAGYYGPAGGPLHSWAGHLLDTTLAPIRNTFKFEPVIGVAIALGCAHLIQRLRLVTIRFRPGRLVAGRAIATPLVALALAGLALPQLSGRSLPAGSFTAIPAYWTQAAAYLARHSAEATTLVVPADAHGQFSWGTTTDNPLEPLATSPWADRSQVPYEGPGPQILLDTVQQAIEAGGPVPGLAAYLARAGVRYILVRNDVNPETDGYIAPQILNESLAQSGYHRVAAFGPSVTGSPSYPNLVGQAPGYALSYPTVEIFAPDRPAASSGHPVAALPVAKTVLVNGGPDALLQLAGEGLLASGQPAVIAGQALAGQPAMWAVTDGQRRADTSFGTTQNTRSYTYTAGGTIPADSPLGGGGGPPRQLLPVPAAGHQTVAVFSGAANVTASSAGTWYAEAPQYAPANAFDGDPGTAWAESNYATPVGQWIQINFGRSRDLPSVATIRLLDAGSRALATRLTVTSAAGKAVTSTTTTGAAQPLRLPKGPSSWMRITITAATNVTPGGPGAGISDVAIPGVRVTTFLQPAEDPAGVFAPVAAYSFSQPAPTPAAEAFGVRAEPIYRLFTTPAAARLTTTLTVVPTAGPPLQSLLDRLTPATKSQFTVTASSSWQNLPAFGPANLFHRTPDLPWLASATDRAPTLTVRWHGRRTIARLILDPASRVAVAPASVRITSPAGTRVAAVGPDGVVTVRPALRTSRLQITLNTSPAQSASAFPVGLAGLRIPGLHGRQRAAPRGSTLFRLACGQGPPVSVDGRIYQTSVAGTIGDLVHLRPVRARVCGNGGTIALPAGKHQLAAAPSAVFAVSDIALSTAPQPARAAGPASSRTAAAVTWQADRRVVYIGRGPESYLEIHENFNPGWTATLAGRPLRAMTLDGWQQAFIVPAGAGGLVRLIFRPARVYHLSLIASAAMIVVLVLAAVGILPGRLRLRRRLRRRRAGAGATGHRQPRRRTGLHPTPARAGIVARLLPLTVVIFLTGGLVALAVPVLGLIRYRRPGWLPWIAASAMACAGAAMLTTITPTAPGHGAFSGFAQVAALIALAAALTPAMLTGSSRSARAEPPGAPRGAQR